MSKAELLLWGHLKSKSLRGYKFRRQYSVNNYVVDFYCPKLKLAIEIDDGSHFEKDKILTDLRRQKFIETFGIRFLRFTNQAVSQDLEGVLEKITEFMRATSPSPLLVKEGNGG